MNIIPHLFIPLSIGVVIFIIAFFKWTKWAIAGLIIAKPVIDLTWDYSIIGDINFLKIYAGLFVMLGLIYVVYHRVNVTHTIIHKLWIVFLCLNFISIFIIADYVSFIDKIDYFLRILNGFVTLILLASLFDYRKDKKFILSIFIIASIFPLLLWLIPVALGNPIFSNDHLRRIIGPYHGFWHFNFYGLQAIICCMAYLTIQNNSKILKDKVQYSFKSIAIYFKNTKFIKSLLLFIVIGLGILMVYKSYSKSGWLILVISFVVWFSLKKKFILSLFVLVVVTVMMVLNPFAFDVRKTFDNEIDYMRGIGTKDRVFRGRLNQWELGMTRFRTQGPVNILFGSKEILAYPENDYLRVLWDNGILGFVVFLLLLGSSGYFLLHMYQMAREPIVLTGILVLIMHALNGIGSYPMLNSAFQWFMWGMVGFIVLEHRNMKS